MTAQRHPLRWRPWWAAVIVGLMAVTLAGLPATAVPDPGGIRPGPGHEAASSKPVGGVPKLAQGSARPASRTPAGAALIASNAAELTPCEDPTFLCTTVPVPLDRRDPDGRTVDIHVEVFPHTGPDPEADGSVFVTCGGPGCAISFEAKYGFTFFALSEAAETRDLVFIDQRGVGRSDVIDCPGLQAGVLGTLYRSARECHDLLGDTADLYSTTDVADDIEDVRAALGYDQIDLFGASYAGADMMTYAIRHKEHVRSLVLSAPAMVVGLDPFYPQAPEAMPRIVEAVCERSLACGQANRRPAHTFAELARKLRHDPVFGAGVDSIGAKHRLKVTENSLIGIAYFNGAHFTGPGEITQATKALRKGDKVPLLRLAADTDPANGFGGAELVDYSAGHSLARSCVDGEFPFDKEAGSRVRRHQFAAAYAAEPDRYGVISKRAWAAPGWTGFQPNPCIVARWEDRPLYAPGTTVSGVPTLVLAGEYDLSVPESVAVLATEVMEDSTFVSVTAAGHDPHFWGSCGAELAQRFIADLDAGDTSCAEEPAGGWWVPGSFPTKVGDAPALATQTGGPKASAKDRRLITAIGWTVLDSLQHNFFVPGDSVGLRGGEVAYQFIEEGEINEWTLHGARFTKDLAVDGPVRNQADNFFAGELVAHAPGGRDLPFGFEGAFEDLFTLTIDLGKGEATFTVPAF